MVAGFAEVTESEATLVAGDRFEPITIGSPVATLLTGRRMLVTFAHGRTFSIER